MRRTRIGVISAIIGGIAALGALYLWLDRCPVELSVVGVEPSFSPKYMQVTLGVRLSGSLFAYDIPSFEAKVGGRWIEIQNPGAVLRDMGGGEFEETLVMPEDTKACRVQLAYSGRTWKSRFIERIGPRGRSWVTKSWWLHKLVRPGPNDGMFAQPWKTNTVEIIIARSDRKPAAKVMDRLTQKIASAERVARPRKLTAEQAEKLRQAIKAAPKLPVRFEFADGDVNADEYARQLRGVFSSAGFPVSSYQANGQLDPSIHGIYIFVHSMEPAPGHMDAVVNGFREVNPGTITAANSSYEANSLTILVGHTPSVFK